MAYTFDGSNKRINLSGGTTSFSVRDLWSRWIDWLLISDNSKYLLAFSSLGGDEIDPVEGTFVPIYAFLLNGWRIKPQEASHTLKVQDGILLVDGGGDPFVDTTGSYVVRVNYQQPVQAISFSSEGGGGATTEDIADAVWNEAMSEHLTDGSVGKKLNDGAGSSGWDELVQNHTISNSMGLKLKRISGSVSEILKIIKKSKV